MRVDLRAVAARATGFVPAIQQYLPLLAHFDSLRDQLPPSVVASLTAAGASAEQAMDEAAAADAALSAVRQVGVSRFRAASGMDRPGPGIGTFYTLPAVFAAVHGDKLSHGCP